ncbi:hypothetical protein ABIE30_000623 [Janthinobacterium lividum]|uniref:hypothetical protein n=1 Tax=Janthinobacterium lividum TaxID=29581 RepID=UPI003D25001C
MVAGVPKLKSQEIHEELVLLLNEIQVNEFKLKSYERDIEQLFKIKAIDPAQYQMLFAILKYNDKKRIPAIDHARSAIALAPRSYPVLATCIAVFCGFGCVLDVISLIHRLLEISPDSKKNLRNLIGCAQDTMQLKLANSLQERYEKLAINDDIDNTNSPVDKWLSLSLAYSRNTNIADDFYAERLIAAVGAIRNSNFEVLRTTSLILEDGTVSLHYHIDASPKECSQVNFAIADALVEKFDDTGIEHFSIVSRPLTDLHEINNYKDSQ